VPAYNEQELISETVRALNNLDLGGEVIVVDDGSRDKTAAAAAREGARVIRLAANRGKGNALNAGVKVAQADILGFVDADLGRSASLLLPLFKPVMCGEVDMTIAAFPPPRQGGFGMVQGLSRWMIARETGFIPRSPLSGQRVVTRELLQQTGPLAPGFAVEVVLTIAALRHGFRVREISLPLNHRERGRDILSFLHRGRQLWSMIRVVAWNGF